MNTFTFKKFNKERLFNIDTSDFDYIKPEEVYGALLAQCDGDINEVETTPIPVRGVYISTKSKYGLQPQIATDDSYISLPHHMLEQCQMLLQDPKAIAGINEGKCCVYIRAYTQKRFNKTCYTFEFADYVELDD